MKNFVQSFHFLFAVACGIAEDLYRFPLGTDTFHDPLAERHLCCHAGYPADGDASVKSAPSVEPLAKPGYANFLPCVKKEQRLNFVNGPAEGKTSSVAKSTYADA